MKILEHVISVQPGRFTALLPGRAEFLHVEGGSAFFLVDERQAEREHFFALHEEGQLPVLPGRYLGACTGRWLPLFLFQE